MDYYAEVLWDSVPIGKSSKIWSVSTPNKIQQIQLEEAFLTPQNDVYDNMKGTDLIYKSVAQWCIWNQAS